MSLDVYLRAPGIQNIAEAIFVREDGAIRELTRAEWDARYPDREPIYAERGEDEVYSRNITHNLNEMAVEAGIYEPLWRPDQIGIKTAKDLIEPLRKGLALLRSDPERFKKFNPENGWGNYEGLVDFVQEYLKACEENPDAEVSVSR